MSRLTGREQQALIVWLSKGWPKGEAGAAESCSAAPEGMKGHGGKNDANSAVLIKGEKTILAS